MKLLIITQKIDKNDPILGFFHGWVQEFAKHFEFVTIICLEKGEYNLPSNTKVLSLGKESGVSRIKYLMRFYRHIWRERKNYDTVFVHMNPEYIVLGGLLWKLFGKKINLWYTHRQMNLKLSIAEKFSNIIFTASKESFKLKSDKVHIVGHGIDVEKFKKRCDKDNNILNILHAGRITKIKNIATLIETAKILKDQWGKDFRITLLGSPATDKDDDYFEEMKLKISKYNLDNRVIFKGSVSNNDIINYYCNSDITVNLTPTGGIDKAVLESMASGVPVLSSNEAFSEYFGEYSKTLLFKERDANDLSVKIKELFEGSELKKIGEFLHSQVQKKASVVSLIKNISEYMK